MILVLERDMDGATGCSLDKTVLLYKKSSQLIVFFYFAVKDRKSDMRIFAKNFHTAYIQRFKLYWIATRAVSIRPR